MGKEITLSPDGTILLCANKDVVSVEIPNSVRTIKQFAFEGCSSLKNIVIPDSVTEIEGRAFGGCSSLERIYIPYSVKKIGWTIFFGCHSLAEIHCGIMDIKQIKVDSLFDEDELEKYSQCVLFVPQETKLNYLNYPLFGKFKNIEIESN